MIFHSHRTLIAISVPNWENKSGPFPHFVVTKDVEPWTVVGGNPAKFIKKRVLFES